MKCDICKGIGKVEYIKRGKMAIGPCYKCEGTGIIKPLTNKEFLRNCSDEELENMVLRLAFMYELVGKKVSELEYCDLSEKQVVKKWQEEIHEDE